MSDAKTDTTSQQLKVGLLINPVAGLGGAVALKGSDGKAIQQQARALGAKPQANERARTALMACQASWSAIDFYAGEGDMGASLLQSLGIEPAAQVAPHKAGQSSPNDTELAVRALVELGIDLLLFAGGDGTARNVFNALRLCGASEQLPVIGIPAGCKIHSAVYATSPQAAGELLRRLVAGQPMSLNEADVRDLDEELFRQGQVNARHYGYLLVPEHDRLMQSMKQGGVNSDALAMQDIAAYLVDSMEPETLYVMGSGSTVEAVMTELGLDNTLLGVDLVKNGELVSSDVTAADILASVKNSESVRAVLTLIGGQGHLFGRGNQQFSPEVIRAIGIKNVTVIATLEKLASLKGRPLLVDTGDRELDRELYGMLAIITGYEHTTLYRVGYQDNESDAV